MSGSINYLNNLSPLECYNQIRDTAKNKNLSESDKLAQLQKLFDAANKMDLSSYKQEGLVRINMFHAPEKGKDFILDLFYLFVRVDHNSEMFNLFVNSGLNLDSNTPGTSPLYRAMSFERSDCASVALINAGADLSQIYSDELVSPFFPSERLLKFEDLLVLSAARGLLNTFQTLLTKKPNFILTKEIFDRLIDALFNFEYFSPNEGREKLALHLLNNMIPKNVNSFEYIKERGLFNKAVRCGYMKVVKDFLEKGHYDINSKDESGKMPLHRFLKNNRQHFGRIEGDSVFIFADFLIQQGALLLTPDINHRCPLDYNPNFAGVWISHIEVPESLSKFLTDREHSGKRNPRLSSFPLLHQRGPNGITLLHWAAKKKDTRFVKLLLEKGVSPYETDDGGHYPKDLAKTEELKKLLAIKN